MVSKRDVAPIVQPDAPVQEPDAPDAPVQEADAPVFVSEGMRHDIELYGFAVDPVTGRRVNRDER